MFHRRRFIVRTPIYRAGVSTPIYRARVRTPIYRAGVSTPIHRAGVRTPIYRAGVSTPIHRAGVSTPIHRAGVRMPVILPSHNHVIFVQNVPTSTIVPQCDHRANGDIARCLIFARFVCSLHDDRVGAFCTMIAWARSAQ